LILLVANQLPQLAQQVQLAHLVARQELQVLLEAQAQLVSGQAEQLVQVAQLEQAD
jgi:hypothetical protein